MILFRNLSPEDQTTLNELIAEKVYADIDDGTNGDILSAYASRFPQWTFLMEPAKCAMTMRQLELKSSDYFYHTPTVLEMFVIVRMLEDWVEFLEDDEREQDEQAAKIQRLIALICPRPDLLYRVEPYINDALAGGKTHLEAGIRLEDYNEILPPDIVAQLSQQATSGKRT